MLSDAEIERLFDLKESDRVERKASYTDPDKVRQAICAFANDFADHRLPGVIFVGQKDDLSPSGLTIDDSLLLKLSYIRNEGRIIPFPVMTVNQKTIRGAEVAVIQIAPSDRPPVRLDGRTWIRVGPRRATATVEEERRLTERQLWANLPFDARPFSGATIADLDLARFEREYVPAAFSREINDENGRSTEEKLRALRLIAPDNTPTAAALLLLAPDPRAFMPGAYIQFLRVNGTELFDEITDQKELSGTIPDQVRQIDEIVNINNRTGAVIGGLRRQESSDYPIAALEQLVRNALLHRNYEHSHAPCRVYWFNDRIEIHNAGGLFGEVTPETIWQGVTSYRNPLLAEGLKSLGVVERFGFGIAKTKISLERNQNPNLETVFAQTAVVFIVKRRP